MPQGSRLGAPLKRTTNEAIANEAWPFILIAAVLYLLVYWLNRWASIPFFWLILFVIYFFRNPKRKITEGSSVMVAPADGKVIFVGEVSEERLLNKKMQRVSIFMSPLNVHVNRIPIDGTITKVSYNKGKFFPAHAEKASLDNEQNAIVFKTKGGNDIIFTQIAGWLARRIVNYAKDGETWTKGSIFGLIRFGSRMDVYLPLGTPIKVKVGDVTVGGETVLADIL